MIMFGSVFDWFLNVDRGEISSTNVEGVTLIASVLWTGFVKFQYEFSQYCVLIRGCFAFAHKNSLKIPREMLPKGFLFSYMRFAYIILFVM